MSITRTKTEQGIVQGIQEDWGSIFKSIPYAAPPVGELRFAAPQPADSWDGTRKCTKWPDDTFRIFIPIPGMPVPKFKPVVPDEHTCSEDCLYMNIWTPADTETDRLPVVFWMYGNGGSSHSPAVNGEAFAKKGVILVTFNYRQDVFGWTGLKELADRDPNGSTGCTGLQDILFALKWVRRNIPHFGGDPDNITIAGHSAGAMFVKFLLTCREAEGLFRHAISMSGGGTWDIDPVYTKKEKIDFCQTILDKAGWTFEDVMTRSSEEVYRTFKEYEKTLALPQKSMMCSLFLASMDDCLLKRYYGEELYDGYFNENVDVMGGMLVEEWHNIPCQVPGGIKGYEREFAIASIVSWAKRNAQRGFRPMYPYFFDHRMPEDGHWMRHGDEMCYTFGTLDIYAKPYAEYDRCLSDITVGYWTEFAKKGDPNGEGLPVWKPYTLDEPVTMHFADDHIVCEDIAGYEKAERAVDFLLAHPGMLDDPFPYKEDQQGTIIAKDIN